ncbi:MAG: tRNA epoxyqueuosine(34) reductase QueG, partial [Bacteroidales bacterium]|nr:tRNA epoxyqueuosine(34) reductase QueG [Bacteroidales bacterium]
MMRFLPLEIVKEKAISLGFNDCGAAKVEQLPTSKFDEWIKKGYNANMNYLNNYHSQRFNPCELLEGAKTVFSFIISYNTENQIEQYTHKIASYAQGFDYHKVIKNKLYILLEELKALYPDFQAKICVDTAPVMEKHWAVKAGLGWIGKNTCFISEKWGSKVFLAEIICNYESDYTQEVRNQCGNCRKCIESCPNQALNDQETGLDSNKCISYQTIENKDSIPCEIKLNNYIYGCDICLNACIRNNKAIKVNNEFSPTQEIKTLISK